MTADAMTGWRPAESDRRAWWIHWLAVATALISLVPIVMGSLVTTLGAGMAFLDWPTSDGQGMLAYPWLKSSGDQFIEHGHRLAGMLIGFCGIILCGSARALRASPAIQRGTVIALAGIIIQGLIGGARVRLDQQTIAMGHSIFGGLVFVVLWKVAGLSRPGRRIEPVDSTARLPAAGLAVAWPLLCLTQYVVGAFLRHLGRLMFEHLGGAVLVLLTGIVVIATSRRAGSLIRRRSGWVAAAIGLQILIGLAVWVLKFGFPPLAIVAVQHSVLQVVSRSLHTVGGMCVLVTAVAWSGAVLRAHASRRSPSLPGTHE